MNFEEHPCMPDEALIDLFRQAFTASEGVEEGQLIATLVRDLLVDTAREDIYVFTALDKEVLVGAAIFTRLCYSNDHRCTFILGPMATMTTRQGQGIGKALIRASLQALRAAGVDIVMTYGDPAFYSKTGFSPVSEKEAPAPYELQYPHGWLVNKLSNSPVSPLAGPVSCVPALRKRVYW